MRAAEAAGLGQSLGRQRDLRRVRRRPALQDAQRGVQRLEGIPPEVFGAPFKAASVGRRSRRNCWAWATSSGRGSPHHGAGGVLAYLVLIPLIKFFGEHRPGRWRRGRSRSRRWARMRSAGPTFFTSARARWRRAASSACCVRCRRSGTDCKPACATCGSAARPPATGAGRAGRTERDLSMKFVGHRHHRAGRRRSSPRPALHMNLLGALLIVVFGFLFVTVSSRLTGEIGSSSNPISGMTVATLLLTCLIFLIVGWTGGTYYVTALSVGAIVCIAASNGGATSQDLKTGFLLGATPRLPADRDPRRGAAPRRSLLGPILLALNTRPPFTCRPRRWRPVWPAPSPASLDAPGEAPAARRSGTTPKTYLVWQKTDAAGGPAGKYLVDATAARCGWSTPASTARIPGGRTARRCASSTRRRPR